jgi:hypothetical protein
LKAIVALCLGDGQGRGAGSLVVGKAKAAKVFLAVFA